MYILVDSGYFLILINRVIYRTVFIEPVCEC